jgi:acetylornithine deacetylase/succinyl-diaminopimelate desuccinylase-like protein
MEVVLSDGGMNGSAESAITRQCARAIEDVLGGYVIAGAQYGTDASKLAKGGTPSVVLGPGNIAQAHTSVEWVEIAQVEQAVEVYRRIMNAS